MENSHLGQIRQDFPDKFEDLGREIFVQICSASSVMAGMGKTGNETSAHRIIHEGHHNRYWRIEGLRRQCSRWCIHQDYARLKTSQFSSEFGKAVILSSRKPRFENKVAALN